MSDSLTERARLYPRAKRNHTEVDDKISNSHFVAQSLSQSDINLTDDGLFFDRQVFRNSTSIAYPRTFHEDCFRSLYTDVFEIPHILLL